MKQIFILGASSVYGVGAEHDGWGDLVKSYVHEKMYGPNGVGEQCEVFNFSKAGSTIDFVVDNIDWAYGQYGRGSDILTLISVGGNDSKAVDTPDNFVCTPQKFRVNVSGLLDLLQQKSQRIVFVRNNFVDETKVSPKRSPFGDGKVSYFTNERLMLFNNITKEACESRGIDFVTTTVEKEDWIQNYLYVDGLHPNQAGYQKVFEVIQPVVDNYLA